jgi:predicted nuclease of predicted toxin-antitoxin system
MKLLLDENLSPMLASQLSDLYPESLHVRDCGLKRGSDSSVWEFARENGFTIVSKDSDFDQIRLQRGHPPKVIWLRLGNCTTGAIEDLLRTQSPVIHNFQESPTATLLILPSGLTR